MMVARSAFVFDLFHTLVDTEHLRPRGFQAVTATSGSPEARSAWTT